METISISLDTPCASPRVEDTEFFIRVYIKIRTMPPTVENISNLKKLHDLVADLSDYKLPKVELVVQTEQEKKSYMFCMYKYLQTAHDAMKAEVAQHFRLIGIVHCTGSNGDFIYNDTATGAVVSYEEYERRYAVYLYYRARGMISSSTRSIPCPTNKSMRLDLLSESNSPRSPTEFL